MIKVNNIKVPVEFNKESIINKIAKELKISKSEILDFVILKKSIDARRKPNIFVILNLGVILKDELKFNNLKIEYDNTGIKFDKLNVILKNNPVIVGFGPSGMFLGLALSQMGLNPIIIEQGSNVTDRANDVKQFWETGKLNEFSNVQFGEGGAGTFSDGKLNTNLNNQYCQKVINTFVNFGAPSQIAYESKPHIGSDELVKVVKKIREEVIKNGGTILFNTKLTNIVLKNNAVTKIEIKNLKNNISSTLLTNNLFLAIGHSAIDTFELLKNLNVNMQQKPFAMGVRIEQSQNLINLSQYGKLNKNLPSADYKLVAHLNNGRSVFTFCMCPGGVVVNSASEKGTIVTNGMSYFKRDGNNANSAILVNVVPNDFESDDVLAGLYFQRKYEKLAFEIAGSNYYCPAQSVGEFLTGKPWEIKVTPSLKVNVCDISKCLPKFIVESLKIALPMFNKKISGFADYGNVLIGVESRSSSPVTIIRNENFESNILGLFPIGEGAGYAGGIISSAIDGIKAAIKFSEKLKK